MSTARRRDALIRVANRQVESASPSIEAVASAYQSLVADGWNEYFRRRHRDRLLAYDAQQITFTLSRRSVRQTFEHFADALTYGEPYGASNPPPPPPEQTDPTTIDTTTPAEPTDDRWLAASR